MNRNKIIYRLLNSDNNKVQNIGLSLANKVKDLNFLIMPPAPPLVWENCAKALYEMSDDKLEKYLPSLLEWLQDLNWPGALVISDRLKIFSREKLEKPFIDCVLYADSLNNEEGCRWLDYLSELLDNEDLKAKLPNPTIEKLQMHYKNWGYWWGQK